MQKEKPYSVNIVVRGHELDSFKHVNNAVYLNYFEHTRWMAFREHLGTDVMVQESHSYIVRKISVEYMKPAFVFDELQARLWVERIGNTSITLGQDIVRLSDNAVLAQAEVVLVSLGREGKPSPVPAIWRNYTE